MMNDNYFGFVQPENANCHIYLLRDSHPVLIIEVKFEKQPPVHISFITPIYFDGTMSWRGANFELAEPSECYPIWESFWRLTVPEEVFMRNYKLFRVAIKDTQPVRYIKIVSAMPKVKVITSPKSKSG
jgi:hypothetical protein